MRARRQTVVVAAALALAAAACTGAPATPDAPIRHTDAGLDAPPAPDAHADAAIDAAPDAMVDADGDGYPSTIDCDDADPTAWALVAYGARDVDGDGRTVDESGVVCAGTHLPAGYRVSAGPPDCDDHDAAVYDAMTGFADADGDGVGAGAALALCTNGALPAGTAATDTDCDDTAADRWALRAYAYRDADGDGATVAQAGVLCTGAALPAGYRTTPGPADCDDGDPTRAATLTVYADADHDGVGAGPPSTVCTNGTPPPGTSLTGYDCDDGDATRSIRLGYVAIDQDQDGATIDATGSACTNGTLPDPYRAARAGNDCDDLDPTRTRWAVLYPDHDHDGVGAPPREIDCIGATIPVGLSPLGDDPDDGDPDVRAAFDDEDDGLR